MEIPTAAQELIHAKLRLPADEQPADERWVNIVGHCTIKITQAPGETPILRIKDDGSEEWDRWFLSESEFDALAKIVHDAHRQWKAGQ